MSASFRDRFGTAAVVLLLATGCLSSVARADDGVDDTWDGGHWIGNGLSRAELESQEPSNWMSFRVNALYLNRTAPASNVVLSDSATGNGLLNTSANDPSWAGGTEVNLLVRFTPTAAFEFDWFSVDDWFDQKSVSMTPTTVNEVPFSVTDGAVSVSSRLRNMEFNLREEVYDGVTLLAGFRYVEFLDAQGIQYQNKPANDSEVIQTNIANRLYGFQIGTQLDLWTSNSFDLTAWGKVGIYGNAVSANTAVTSTVPGNAAYIPTQAGKTAFVGDLGVRGTYKFNEVVGIFVGYRLMYLDGIALAANQYPNTVNYFQTGVPSIKLGNSMLFQGIEAGLSFSF